MDGQGLGSDSLVVLIEVFNECFFYLVRESAEGVIRSADFYGNSSYKIKFFFFG